MTTVNWMIPVGTILPYVGTQEDIPEGWRLCDGAMVDDEHSPWHQRRVPDLRGRYLKGLTDPEDSDRLGTRGGRSSASHKHDFSHTHVGVTFESEWSDADTGNGSGQANAVPSDTGPRAHVHSYATSAPVPGVLSSATEMALDPSYVAVNYIIRTG